MSIPLGGFHFDVGFRTTGANAALEKLRRDARAIAEDIKQAFAGATIAVNTSAATASMRQFTQAAKQAQDIGKISVAVTAEGAAKAARDLQSVTNAATLLAGRNVRLSLQVNAASTMADIQAVERQVRALDAGQGMVLNLRMNLDQARQTLTTLGPAIKAATASGATVTIKVDDKGARTDAKRALDDIARQAKQADAAQVASARQAASEMKQISADLNRAIRREQADTRREEATTKRRAAFEQQAAQDRAARIRVVVEGGEQAEVALKDLANLAELVNKRQINIKVSENAERAKKQMQELAQAIDRAKSGERLVINAQVNNRSGLQAMGALAAAIKQAEARGVHIQATVDTTKAKSALSALSGVGGGVLRGVVAGSGAGGGLLIGAGLASGAGIVLAVALGVQALTSALIDGLSAGLQYNQMLEQATQTFELFTGGVEAAQVSLAGLRKYADITPFNTKEVIASGQAFALASGGNIKFMQRQVELAGQLAATNPAQGLEGATRALRELQGGQVESIAERFNIPRSTIQALKDLGLAGEALSAAVVKAAGGSEALVKAFGESLQGRISTAKSNLEEFQRVASEPIGVALSEALRVLNKDFETNKAVYIEAARAIGVFAGGATVSFGQFLQEAAAAVKKLGELAREAKFFWALILDPQAKREAAPAVPQLNPAQQANQDASEAQLKVLGDRQKILAQEKKILEGIENSQKAIAVAVAVTTEKYEAQIRPLEAQQRALQTQLLGAQGRSARADEEARLAQAPLALRAQAAATEVLLEHEKALLDIRHQRAELAEAEAEAEIAAANRIAEARIRAEQAALEAMKDRIAAAAAARREAIDGLREEATAAKTARQEVTDALRDELNKRQEARSAVLDALREEIRARQEARQVATDAIKDEIQARQEARTAAIDAIKEEVRARRESYQVQKDAADALADAAERRFQRESTAADQANKRQQDGFRARIDALQRADAAAQRENKGQSQAERDLAAFEAQSKELERAKSIAEAVNNVKEATTSKEWRAARARLAALQEEQARARQKEALEAKVAAEKAAQERASAQRQEQIAALQAQAQAADQKYQREKEDREAQHQAQRDALADQQRIDDQAEKARQREEDQRIRVAEAADKAAKLAEAAQIKAQERADAEAKRADDAQIRAQEQADKLAKQADDAKLRAQELADKAADRAADKVIADAERADREAARNEAAAVRAEEARIAAEAARLKADQDARETKTSADKLARLKEENELTLKILDNKEKILKAEDVNRAAAAAAAKVVAEDDEKRIRFLIGELQLKIDALKLALEEALSRYKPLTAQLEIQALTQKLIVERAEKLVTEAEKQLGFLKDQATELSKIATEEERRLAAIKEEEAVRKAAGTDERTGLQRVPGTGAQFPVSPSGAPAPQMSEFDRQFFSWVASWVERAAQLGRDIIAGITSVLGTDQTGPQAVQDWGERGAVALESTVWQAASPSQRAATLAYNIADGFIQQMAFQTEFIQAALVAAFTPPEGLLGPDVGTNAAYVVANSFVVQMEYQTTFTQQAMAEAFTPPTPAGDPGADVAYAIANGFILQMQYQAPMIVAALQAPLDTFLMVNLPATAQLIGAEGSTAARMYAEAFGISDWWNVAAVNGTNALKNALNVQAPSLAAWGANAAAHYQSGWAQQMASWVPPTPASQGRSAAPPPARGGWPGGPGDGGTAPGRNNPNLPPRRSDDHVPVPFPWPEFARGGNFEAGMGIKVGEYRPEWIVPREPGTVLPIDAINGIARSAIAALPQAGSSVSSRGPVSLHIENHISSAGIVDPDAFAQKVTDQTVAAIIDVLDITQQQAATPVSRILPGAV